LQMSQLQNELYDATNDNAPLDSSACPKLQERWKKIEPLAEIGK
jgi:hypothetical protein